MPKGRADALNPLPRTRRGGATPRSGPVPTGPDPATADPGRTAADDEVQCLPPIADPSARLLLLGSMPGAESLRLQQYYAHPRNQFWPIAGALFGAGPALPYADRLRALRDAGVAVWDVLAACRRPGSLDSAIAPDSIRVNDFAGFFAAHPRLRRIGFNGGFAEATFRSRVQAAGVVLPDGVQLVRLPSTSPAHAAMDLAAKRALWRERLCGDTP